MYIRAELVFFSSKTAFELPYLRFCDWFATVYINIIRPIALMDAKMITKIEKSFILYYINPKVYLFFNFIGWAESMWTATNYFLFFSNNWGCLSFILMYFQYLRIWASIIKWLLFSIHEFVIIILANAYIRRFGSRISDC